jgi:outer membrane immunogenic protein
MKKCFIGIVAIVAILSWPALAADMPTKAPPLAPPAPAPSWTGFYFGGHFGYGWAFPEITADFTGTAVGNPPRPRGVLGGVQVGYNWQTNHWVYGLEGDFTWSDIKGTSNVVGPVGILNAQGLPDDLSTITGRVGYADMRMLYYIKGGAAWMSEKFNQLSVTTPNCVGTPCTGSNDTWGWAVGAGAEYAIDPHWSIKLEYNYLDFPRHEGVTTSNGVSTNSFHLTRTFDLIKFGLNYKFGG